MSAAGGSLAVRQAPGIPWKSGQSGNPGGMSKAEREWRDKVKAALRKQQSTAKILSVVEAMRKDATSHGKTAPAAAKVYLEAVGLKDAVTLTEQERIQLGVRAELERLLGEAEAARAREGAIDVTPVTP